ncbi:hypothetical protein ACWC2K_06055 [Streptomyces chattanoogensis]|uniref:hypothetical protein n=1 Tax=Streptomyces chattanoogensis TaxID=66876 RepID=UPI00367B4FF3
MNGLRTAWRTAVSATALAGTVLFLTPQQASACTVGIGYKPSFDIRDLSHPRTCSTGASLGGAGAVALLVPGALVAASWCAHRKAERGFGAPSKNGSTGPSQALIGYLDATGIAVGRRRDGSAAQVSGSSGRTEQETGGHGADRSL